MKLTIKDIAKYYPYKLNFKYQNKIHLLGSLNKARDFDEYFANRDFCQGIHQIKPIFRPLSGLIEEIEHEGKQFVPIVELASCAIGERIENYQVSKEDEMCNIFFDHNREDDFYDSCFSITEEKNGIGFRLQCLRSNRYKIRNQEEIFQKLYSWHFWTGDQSYFDKGLLSKKQ